MLVADSVPSLINGVSQQPQTLRALSRVGVQDNAHSSEVSGLGKRPPLDLLAKLTPTVYANAHVHAFQDSAGVPYVAVFTETVVRVFDYAGVEKTVNTPDGLGYLTLGGADPRDYFRALTVADFTFFLNRKIAPALSATLSPTRPFEGLALFRQGAYGKTYTVKLTRPDLPATATGTYTVPDGSIASHISNVGTDYIAQQVLTSITAGLGALGVSASIQGSVLSFTCATDFEMEVTDDFNNNGAVALKGRTQRFFTLPNVAPEGFEIQVIGDDTTAFDDYYVKFTKLSAGDNTGVWDETIKQGIQYRFNLDTMPYVLVREVDGTFTFRRGVWGERGAGDETSRPSPSFLGKTLSDIFIYRNRLGFVAGEFVVLSRAGDLFDFWSPSATTVLDDSPIDISAAGETATLHAATPFASRLVLWGTRKQLSLTSGELLTPRTVTIDTLTDYESDADVRPLTLGDSVFFPRETGQFTRLWEFRGKDDGLTFGAQDVTVQAPTYIPGGVRVLAGNPSNGTVAVLSDAEPNAIYVYKFYYVGREKAQDAVYRWVFPSDSTLLSLSFAQEKLAVVWSQAGQGTYLGEMDLEDGASDADATYLTHLDRKVSEADCTVTLLTGPTRTRVTLPYAPTARTILATRVNAAAPLEVPSEVPAVLTVAATYIEVAGDYSTRKFYVGETFDFLAELSTLYVRRANQAGAGVAVVGGRLQVRYLTVNYAGTGSFTMRVTARARTAISREFNAVSTGLLLGESVSDSAPVSEGGSFRFPIQGRNTETKIELLDSTHLPAKFQSLEWSGFYHNRERSL